MIKEGLKVSGASAVVLIVALLLRNYINYSVNFIVLLVHFTMVIILLSITYLVTAYLLHSAGLKIFAHYAKKFLNK